MYFLFCFDGYHEEYEIFIDSVVSPGGAMLQRETFKAKIRNQK